MPFQVAEGRDSDSAAEESDGDLLEPDQDNTKSLSNNRDRHHIHQNNGRQLLNSESPEPEDEDQDIDSELGECGQD